MDLENIMPSEINQSEEAKNHMISLYVGHKSKTQTAVWWLPEGQESGEGASRWGQLYGDFEWWVHDALLRLRMREMCS